MKIVYFAHSLISCWNHGNAHFLRGMLRDLAARGHRVVSWEAADNWSLANLMADQGRTSAACFERTFPDLDVRSYGPKPDVDQLIDGADVVIVHEWNDPALVAAIGRRRARGARFALLFHDTHHRAISDPAAMRAYDLSGYDGVLAFGAALVDVYRDRGLRAWTWHEAADLRLFRPPATEGDRKGLVWIGNWGDGERSAELEDFLLRPARRTGLPPEIYGVRYPAGAVRRLDAMGARYHGWTANADVPDIFARHLMTVHVPRRYYATLLPGIPTIRMFEALACGIPLISAPWDDCEELFREGEDYLVARDGADMTRHMRALKEDSALRAELAANGLETIRAKHGCSHRVDELLGIVANLRDVGEPQPERSVA